LTQKAPTPRIFQRVPGGGKQDACAAFKEAVLTLMSIGGVPADRADLKAGLAQRMQELDEDDLEAILYAVEMGMSSSFFKQRAENALPHVTPDEARAVVCLTLEHPFPVYKLLNAWLMSGGSQHDADAAAVVVDKVGPSSRCCTAGWRSCLAARRACAARRGGEQRQLLPEERAMFDGHETLCCGRGDPLLGLRPFARCATSGCPAQATTTATRSCTAATRWSAWMSRRSSPCRATALTASRCCRCRRW
jgi:hypothetical protein